MCLLGGSLNNNIKVLAVLDMELGGSKKPAEVKYADLLKLVQVHMTPKPNVIVQHFKFHTRNSNRESQWQHLWQNLNTCALRLQGHTQRYVVRQTGIWDRGRHYPVTIVSGGCTHAKKSRSTDFHDGDGRKECE